MKLLVADKLPSATISALEEAGFTVTIEPGLKDEALVDAVASGGAEVLVVRSTKVPRAVLEGGSLGLVVRAGAGYNNVDVAAASELGIYVANCPGKNAIAVAELTWGLILGLDRRIPDCVAELRAGRWDKKRFSQARGLHGRTLGLIGLGEIGKAVAARGRAFGMRVLGWSRSLDAERAKALKIEPAESPLAVARQADVVSVHVALTPQTKHLIGGAFFEAMRPGAFFVNTSRGDVVDGAALAAAIESKRLRAGLDVWNQQPADAQAAFTDPLGALPDVYGTHHIGASTDQAQEAVAAEVVRIARAYRETGEVPNCVNLCAKSPAQRTLVVRHLDKVGVLAYVLERLKAADINVQEMENVVFEGARAACATIRLDAEPGSAVLEELRGSADVLGVRVS